ncbi:uncharacterized protein [Primulina eburnea]|uniref:uncharacterized protein isoform X2 n=1 Tax=Primulina eburnea TaxID=1245227 RepID=UPI003C6C1DFB
MHMLLMRNTGSGLMNEGSDKQFQNRWDFRRREEEADSSSDDSKSKSGAEAEDRNCKLLSNLAVPENIEVLATPRFQKDNELDHDKDVHVLSEKTGKKKVKPTKKKKNTQLEKTKKSPIEEKKTRRKKKKSPLMEKKTRRRNTNDQEKKMSEDLKNFKNSLVQELKVARENMFAQMKEEMRKMTACRSSSGPRSNRFNGMMGRCHKSNVDLKTAKASGLSSILPNEPNPVVCSPHSTPPTVATKPHLQSNVVPLNDYIREATPKINAGSDVDIRKLMNSKNHGGFPAFHPTETQLGSCSLISCKHSGQNLSQTTNVGLGFPFPGLHQVMDKDSNMSTLTEDCRLGPRMNGSVVKFLEGNPTFSRMQFNKRP